MALIMGSDVMSLNMLLSLYTNCHKKALIFVNLKSLKLLRLIEEYNDV